MSTKVKVLVVVYLDDFFDFFFEGDSRDSVPLLFYFFCVLDLDLVSN
jgi:hypothetical protein